jgi:hypothetical protein
VDFQATPIGSVVYLIKSGKSIQVRRDLHSHCDGEAPVLKSPIIFVVSRLIKDLGPHVHCIGQFRPDIHTQGRLNSVGFACKFTN